MPKPPPGNVTVYIKRDGDVIGVCVTIDDVVVPEERLTVIPVTPRVPDADRFHWWKADNAD